MRWRNVKQSRSQKPSNKDMPQENYATYPQRIKALIVDLFMLYMPILYILTYLVLGGKDEFQSSTTAPLVAWALYGIIYAVFLTKSGQTPGKKAYEIKVVNDDDTKLSIFKAVARYLLFLFSASIVIGVITPLIRKDKKALHDIILNTKEVDLSK